MRRENNGGAVRLDSLHQRPEVASCLRIETGCRLVEKHEPGFIDEGDCEKQSLSLPAGELAIVAVQQFVEGTVLDDPVQVGMPVIEFLEHLQRFPDGQVVLERRILELDTCFLAEALAGGFAEVINLAGGGRCDSLDDLDGRGLAGAIGAQKPEADAFCHRKTDVVYGDNTGVSLDQVPGLECDLHRYPSGKGRKVIRRSGRQPPCLRTLHCNHSVASGIKPVHQTPRDVET